MDNTVSPYLNKGRFLEYYVKSESKMYEQYMYIQGLIDMAHIGGHITEQEHHDLHNLNQKIYKEYFQYTDVDE